ncbi:hypothetical protein [Paenibacillus lutrae]|uniref:Inner spore coat protein n=1 Tax=Paenibacillus lutrae TaxID=2078573 RepID=A0A7X3FKB1_9BACL|nr:hypothetical protein [Paenibacillus lutrae]MVP01319.1 hypothetical protein [Paenibacillus lutrae]
MLPHSYYIWPRQADYPPWPYAAGYPAYGYGNPVPERKYPTVNTSTLSQSILAFRKLMADGSQVLARLADKSFAHQVMSAAQAGNKLEVDRLMKSIGVSSIITTRYTPSSIILEIDPDIEGTPCCNLTMALKWGQ